MPYVELNGKRTYLPKKASVDQIRKLGSIPPDHNVIHRTREGNFPLKDGETDVYEGDKFVQAPSRDKG